MTGFDPTTSARSRARAASPIDGPLVFAIALVISLVISWHQLQLAMHGEADAITTGVRYLIGLGLAWVGTLGLAHLVRYFLDQSVATDGLRRSPAPGTPQRRAEDPANQAGDDSERAAVDPVAID